MFAYPREAPVTALRALAAPEASATITWTTAGADVHVPVTVLVECAGSVGRGFDLQRFLILVDDLSTLE